MDARRVAGFLQVHAEIDQVDHDLRMPLRLHRAAHHPKLIHGLPSLVMKAGMMVWNGRLPGAKLFGWPPSARTVRRDPGR
jgi:hypothetical protein